MSIVRELIADMIKDSQRTPMLASGALLLTVSVLTLATGLGGAQQSLIGAVLAVLSVLDALPFVQLQAYMPITPDGSASLSLDTQSAQGFLTDVVVPIYVWLTLFLTVVRRFGRRSARTMKHFWARYAGVLGFTAVCVGLYGLAALLRADVASLWSVGLILVVIHLALGAWAVGVAMGVDRVLDAIGRRFEGAPVHASTADRRIP